MRDDELRAALDRQGIARLLWQQLLQATGARALTVNSSVSAVAVYRRFGFVPGGEPQFDRCPPYVPVVYARGA